MIHQPNNPETAELAASIEAVFLNKNSTEDSFAEIKSILDAHILTALTNFANEEGAVIPQNVKTVHSLSTLQLWALTYYGVFYAIQHNLNYTLHCAIRTFVEENELNIEEMNLSPVDLTNLIFDTEYDLTFISLGIESFLTNSAAE